MLRSKAQRRAMFVDDEFVQQLFEPIKYFVIADVLISRSRTLDLPYQLNPRISIDLCTISAILAGGCVYLL